ncbi:MAG: ribosome small subunit-dependent GTPase A [Streptomycetaceae bacterium]|jgi:ribosome biogenesis GTPase|nr:MAG: ribosome small subunit-dependent GTPase A [Streptomycetaceae bacterium]
MSPREYDESDARVRPSRSTRPRSKDRPSHSDAINALVTTVDRGRQTCITDDRVIITAMRARELGPKSVVVGDVVSLVGDVSGGEGTLARIVHVQERRNSLSRTVDDVAQVERTIVANIDQLVIVVAATNPEPRRGLIDRFLVSAFTEGITPKLIVTKTDLGVVPDFLAEYAKLDVEILHTAIKGPARERDLVALHEMLEGKISVLVGHSGVGKSTLINALVPEADRLTGDVNVATGRGRHTSSSAIALPLATSDGWIIDTPGIRAFGLSHIDTNRIVDAFTDLSEVAANCLSNCSHSESSCSLDAWAAPGGISNPERTARLASLRSLLAVKDQAVSAIED